MNIVSVLAAVARRWYVAVVILGLTAYGTIQLWDRSVPEYTSSSVVSVVATGTYLQAQQSQDPTVISANPYGNGAATVASLLADRIANGNVTLPADARGAALTVVPSLLRAESFFTVTSTAPTPEAALGAIQAVEQQAPALLADFQQRAGTPADQLYSAILSRPPSTPDGSYPSRSRVVVGAALAGTLVTVLLCVLLDSIAARVRSRRAVPVRRHERPERPS